MACPYWWLCGVCTATYRDQKHSSLRAALPEEPSIWCFCKTERSKRRTRGPHWTENDVAFQPSGLKYFTQQRLYICVFMYIHKKGISLCWSTWGGFLKHGAFCVCSSQLERSLTPCVLLMWLDSTQKQIDTLLNKNLNMRVREGMLFFKYWILILLCAFLILFLF